MSREDEAYKSLRRRLNKEQGTKHAYKAQTGNRTEQYISENPLGNDAYQTRSTNAEAAAFDDARRDFYKKYGAPRTPTINPFDGMSYRTPGAQALWDLSQQGITQNRKATDPADRFSQMGATSLHQIGGLPGVVQRKRVEEYKAAQAAPKGMGSFDDMAAAITADKQKREKAAKEALDMRPSYMKQQGQAPVPQDQLKTEDLMDAWYNGSNMEGSRNTAKSYNEYLKDLNTGKQSAQKFSEGVEKGKRDTRNELDLTDEEQAQAALGGGQRAGAQETTAMFTDQEKQNYYYIAGTQGKNDAENYRQYVIQNRGLNEQIAKRNQEAIAREMSYQTPTDRFLFESGTQFLLGAGGALENMSRVPAALTGDTSYRAEGVGQYLSQNIADAVDTSTTSGRVYKTWLQLMNTSGNNAVSIAGGVAFGPGVGSALFAAQAAGDAYQQVINEGGTVQQAQFFAAMQAVDEEVTNALLGGIAARGGGLLRDLIGNTAFARSVHGALKGLFTNNEVGLRIAEGVLNALAEGGSEALQEYVQYFSEKFEKWLATGETPTFNVDGKPMTWDQIVEAKGSAAWDVFANPEALESALMGFLNAGLMNGIGTVGRTADAWNRGGALSQDSYQSVLDMVDPNITHYRSEDTYRAGKEAVELARDQQRRVEAGQGDSILSRYGRGLMDQAAEEYQRQYAKNETAGRTYYNPEQVKALIAENDRKNRALRRLAFGGETAVDKLERIRSELAGDTAQAAWETPQEDYGVREVTIPAEMHEQYAQDMLNRGSADRLEWEGDSGEMVSLQREDDGYYTFTNERGETITLDPDEASDLLPSGQPIIMYDNEGSTAVETAGTAATPWGQNGAAVPSTLQTTAPSTAAATQSTVPSTASTDQTTVSPTASQISPNTAPSEGVAISQQPGMSGTDRLVQLAGEAGRQSVEQRDAQWQAVYEAGKNRDSGFQTVMDNATMLSEAEKTAAFNQGMQAGLNEVRMEGQINGRTEEGNLVPSEGSGRNVSFRAGEQASGVSQTAGRTAETGNGRGVLGEADRGPLGEGSGRVNTGRTGVASGRNRGFRNGEIARVLERAADKEVRNATADMIEVGEVAPARDLLRTAVPGQTLVPVFGGKTYSLRKTEAMVQAYDKNIMLTPFISSGEIMVGGGESSRAFADPVRRQLGFRLNDEEATGIQLTKHELIEFGIMDGKISVDQAFDLISSVIPQRYIDAIVGEYFTSSTKGMTLTADQTENAFRHAMKEIVCDIGAGIDQISGRIKDEKARRLFEAVHQRANKALTSYLNERLNNAFKAEPAAETAEASSERVELTSEAMTDGVASDGITMEGEDSIQLSEKLYKESGRDFLRNWLAEQEDISQEDKDDIVAQVDHIYDIMQQIKEEAGKDGILDYRAWAEVAERNGRLTVITPNGEYPLNIDFATVCKKRKALDHILNTMVVDGKLEAKDLANADIVRLQNLIKSEGFEIACALCFVDSKRYRIGSWADGLVNGHKSDGKWQYGFNELVRSLVPKGSNLKIDQFNYTGRDVKQPRGRLLRNAKDGQLDFTLIDEVIAKNAKGTWNRNLATAIKEHPELRSLLNSAELLSSVGFDPIKAQNPALFDVINNKGGTSKPKLSFSEVPYLNDILMSDAMTPEAAYAVGGVRIQSFSDFMANMVFDYVQMVSELQAKKLPAHAYTKEAAFVAMFGKTGIKINMSLVPKASTWTRKKINSYLKGFKGAAAKEEALNKLKENAGLDEHGNYIWEDESFPYEVAMHFQADPEYAKNCGTIAVGVSDRHIIKLLNDDRIQMVIPYHKSGINPVVARLRNIDLYNDYTNYQNTRYADGTKLSSSDNTFDFYGSLKETGDPKKTAKEYLAWCKKNGYIPKFDQFKGHPNYYKLLADFRLYDDTGAYAPQGAVKGNYPDNMKDLILNGYSFTDEDGTEYHNGGLLDAQKVSDALRAKTREIINRYNSGEKVQNSSKLSSEEVKLPDVESAADDKDNLNVIRQGSDQDIQYSSKLFDKDISDKLKASMATFFSGTGTVDFALRSIVNHEFAVEYDAKIAAVYRANNGDNIYVDDVRNVNINKHKGRVEYFHASPVCKNYSGAKNNAEELPLDLETAQATADAINTLQPKVVTVENVARYRNSEAIKIIEDALRKNGYTFDKGVYRASDFGGATIRERMFLRAVKDGTLPKIDTSEYAPMSWYDAVQDLIPKLPKVSMPNFMAERLEPSGIDINNLKQPIFILGGNKDRKLSYAEADKPAPTILANSHDGRIVMPDGRILKATPRVMARIQGLPDAFDLKDGKGGMTNAYKVVGNGVPVQLTQGIVGPLLEENLIKQKSKETGIQYSSKLNESDYAPTFYSKLQREIQNFKGEKIGAASVESYLKGKGVKDEEIKWSGIRTFLEGKKSVSKQELMEYLKANELEIEEKVISGGFDTNNEEAYFAAKDALRFDAEKAIDEQGLDVDYNDIEIDEDNPVWEAYYIDKDGNRKVLASVDSEGTRWHDYKLDGGENYREVLFRMPGSDYSNDAMKVHWGKPGVLAHARIQDFDSDDGGKVLFVEEIQSDWHNAGQKYGYWPGTEEARNKRVNEIKEDANSVGLPLYEEKRQAELDRIVWKAEDALNKKGMRLGAFGDRKVKEALLENLTVFGFRQANDLTKLAAETLTDDERLFIETYKEDLAYQNARLTEAENLESATPDAPFRNNYNDFVLKDLLRMAAEGDYDYLAWTTGKMQEERWSDEFAEGYRIEYDQQIPKFLKKYGKQWGAGLTEISLSAGEIIGAHGPEVQELFNIVKDYDPDTSYSDVENGAGYLEDNLIDLIDEGDERYEKAIELARSLDDVYHDGTLYSSPVVPAITVNDAMKNSVLTEGQPMYSSKNQGDIDEAALDPRRVFISYNPDLQNAVREISDVLTAYQELAPTQAEIKRTTRQIAKKFGSHINVDLAARKMETLYNFLAGGGKPDGREVLEISMDIANDILDEATHNDPEIEERWKKFKQEMRKRRIYIPKDRVHDLNPDGIKALRRQWKGKMVFTTDEKYKERYGQIHYIELQQMFPEYFTKNADNMNDIEAIEEIMYAFDAQAPIYEQIYTGATRDEAALEIAYDIMQGYFGNDRAQDRFKKIYRDYVKPIKDRAINDYRDKLRSIELKDAAAIEQRTVFDQIKGMRGSYVVNEKALKDVDAQGRRAMMERLREKAEQDKKRYEEQVEKVKAGYVERSQKDRLMRLAKELRAMKGGPEFEAKKKELIGDLDLIAKGISYNYERKLMDMKEEYERLAEEDENFEPDRATIKKIERLQKKQINQMTAYEITALTEAILKMKQDQWTHNRMIRENDAALVADEGRKIVNETNALKGTKGMNRLADAIDGYSLAHLNSKRAFRKMSGYNDKSGLMKLWNELNEGQHKTMDFRRRAVSPFDAFMSEEENKDFITGMFDPTVEITSSKIEIEDENGNIVRTHEPQTVKITPAMKISIYLHSLNQDNREHARYGGFRIPNMDKYERGDYSNAYGQGSKIVRLTKADMQNIASTMTPQELRFADLAHEYFNKTSKEAINEASMLLNGYELASVDNYMPIKTDPNFTKKDISGLIQDGTIEGQGWTKDRNFMAKNPILLEDITQVLQRSIDGAALYYGLAIPVRNFNKVYEFQRSGYTDSVKEAIMQTFDKRGNEYIEKLLRDLQGGNMDTKDAAGKWVDRFTSGLRGNYAQAILTLNPSVAIKQAASYPTAAARLGFEPLKKALAKLTTSTSEDMDLINKYTPLLWYRAQGQSSDALAEVSKRKEAWQYKGGVEKTRQMFNWIQNIDVKTVKTLWYASEYYVQDNMPSFKEGTEAYYREVAKVFNEVVEDTQPNYTTMQRASISRVDNEIMKAVFMFKTQPLQNVGILYDSIMEYQAKQEAFKQAVKNGFEGDALNEYAADMAFARQGMMRSVASITVSTLVFSAMTQLAKLLLHRVDPMRDEETAELTKASILKNFFGNAAESVAGMLAGAGEIYSLIMAMTTGSYLDNLSVSGIDSLNEVMTKMLKTYQNIGKIWEDEEATPRQKTAASIVASRDLTIQIMDLTGIPANNAKKIAEALINHYHDVINPIFTGRPIDTNLESGAKITDKQYANRALKYYQRNDIAKGDKAAAKIEKASAMQSVLGAKGKKDEEGNSIPNSKKYDAIHKILRTPGSDEAKGKMFAAAYPSDELARYMYGGGSAFDFMQGQMLAEEIAALSEEERKKKLYSFVEETGYTLDQKKAWLVSDKDRIESKTLTAWRDANGTDWDYIKHMSNLEKFNGSKEKKKKVVAYIKRQTTDMKKRKALFIMAGYQLDSKEDGKTVKDGNFKKAMEN